MYVASLAAWAVALGHATLIEFSLGRMPPGAWADLASEELWRQVDTQPELVGTATDAALCALAAAFGARLTGPRRRAPRYLWGSVYAFALALWAGYWFID